MDILIGWSASNGTILANPNRRLGTTNARQVFTPRSAFRNFFSGCESNRVVKQQRLLTGESESSKGLLPGCEPNLHGCFRTPRATGSELSLALRRPNRRKPLEILGFNAKSRERSLSAFCVNQLTGSFRAKILSSPSATLLEQTQDYRALKCEKPWKNGLFSFCPSIQPSGRPPVSSCRLEQRC
jgi:hypothetical protein